MWKHVSGEELSIRMLDTIPDILYWIVVVKYTSRNCFDLTDKSRVPGPENLISSASRIDFIL